MFALVWWAYPIVMACVAVPMTFFYVVERRRERREEAAYDGPCMAHVGTDRGTELWCWQKSGHSGAHDDYMSDDGDWIRAVAKANGYDPDVIRQSDAAGSVVIHDSPNMLPTQD